MVQAPSSNASKSLQNNMNSVIGSMKKIKNIHSCIAMMQRIDFELGFNNSQP